MQVHAYIGKKHDYSLNLKKEKLMLDIFLKRCFKNSYFYLFISSKK